jgi:hypothetical protein
MPVYIKFQLRVYFSFYLAFLLGDRHSPALPYYVSCFPEFLWTNRGKPEQLCHFTQDPPNPHLPDPKQQLGRLLFPWFQTDKCPYTTDGTKISKHFHSVETISFGFIPWGDGSVMIVDTTVRWSASGLVNCIKIPRQLRRAWKGKRFQMSGFTPLHL